MDEVLADAGAPREQVGDRRADEGRRRSGTRTARGIASATATRVASGVVAADLVGELGDAAVGRLRLGLEQVLAGLGAIVLGLDRRPWLRRIDLLLDRRHAHPRLHPQPLVRLGDAELEHLGAEVVAVLVQARLRVDAEAEVVHGLMARGRGLHPQHVEVVAHGLGVVVLGAVGDLEPHCVTTCGWAAAPPK